VSDVHLRIAIEIMVDGDFCGDDCRLLNEASGRRAFCRLDSAALEQANPSSPKPYYRRSVACEAAEREAAE
jgi:hypothetical protein